MGVDQILFSQLCVYYFTEVKTGVINEVHEKAVMYSESVTFNYSGT